MLSLVCALAGLALLVLPPRPARARLHRLFPVTPSRWPIRLRRPNTALVAVVAGLLGGVLAGPGGAVAGTALGGTAWRRVTARKAARDRVAGTAGISAALGSLVGELRAGAHPAVAATSAGQDTDPATALAMSTIAGTARLGGRVDAALLDLTARQPHLAVPLARLAHAWRVAEVHGVALAEVLDAVRRDLDQRVRFTRQVTARLAGPRASAAVLAGLPVAGLLVGELSGAQPVHLLTSTPPGQVLLVLGAALTCAGVRWSNALADRVVIP